jgi:hypothetical protein
LGSLLLVVVHACTLPGMCRMDLWSGADSSYSRELKEEE